jgi:hypothetical protein
MAVTPTRGELGWAKLDQLNLYALSVTPVFDPSLYVPPLLGSFYPLNYATGISTPTVSVRTNPYANFFTAAAFGAWFLGGTARGENDIAACGTIAFFDGLSGTAYPGAMADTFTIEITQGAPVGLTMNFLGAGTAACGTRTCGTHAPAMYKNVAFTTSTGVHRAVLSYSNRCGPSGEIGTNDWPVAINANAPVFSLSLLQKPGGTPPTTSETITITPPGGSAVAIGMKFRLTSGPNRTVVFGETLYERVYSGMHLACGDDPFTII